MSGAILFLRLIRAARQRDAEEEDYRRHPPDRPTTADTSAVLPPPPTSHGRTSSDLPPPTVVTTRTRSTRSHRRHADLSDKKYLPVFLVTAIITSVLIIGFALYDVIVISRYFEKFAMAQTEGTGEIRHQDIHGRNVTTDELIHLHSRYEQQKIMGYVLIVAQLLLLCFASLGFASRTLSNRKLLLPWLISCFPINAYAMVYSVSFTANSYRSMVYMKVLIVVIVFTLTANLFRLVYRVYRSSGRRRRRRNSRSEASQPPLPTVYKGEIQMTPPPYEKDPPPYELTTNSIDVHSSGGDVMPEPVVSPEPGGPTSPSTSAAGLPQYSEHDDGKTISVEVEHTHEQSTDELSGEGCVNSAFIRDTEQTDVATSPSDSIQSASSDIVTPSQLPQESPPPYTE